MGPAGDEDDEEPDEVVGQPEVAVRRRPTDPVVHHDRHLPDGEPSPDGQDEGLDRLHVLDRVLGCEEFQDRAAKRPEAR